MSFEITTNFVQQYRSNITLLAQQMVPRLRGTVLDEPCTGTTLWYDQIGSTTAQQITTRHADTPIANIQHRRRRIDVASWNQAELVDNVDKARLLAEPSSTYAQALVAAMNRRWDKSVIDAFFATANTGADGTTTVAFPSGNQVAVNSWKYGSGTGNAGLTISKLLEAKALLDGAEVDETERYVCVAAKQLADMLATTEATSKDFSAVQSLMTGQLNTFLGFTFIRSEQLPQDGSGYRRVPVWQRKGVLMAEASPIQGFIDIRADKNRAVQPYVEAVFGAARVEEARVIEIKCLES